MNFRPHPALRARVESIDVLEARAGITIFPSANAVLGVQFQGRVRAGQELLSPAGITGITTRARDYSYEGDTASVLVRFTPQGATSLGLPSHELTDQSVPLEHLVKPARLRELRERLAEGASHLERAQLMEAFLLELPFFNDRLIERAAARLSSAHGEDAAIASVARALGLSERQLERRFLIRIGLTPKRFAALRRFERAVALAKRETSLTDLALDAGYYDQPHFIREFRRFTGTTPGAVFRKR